MKKVLFVLLIVLFSGFVLAVKPSVGDVGGDVDDIQGVIDELPFDDDGDVNFSKYKPYQSKAEERIAAVNVYVGPITRVLWGVEFTLSWIFVFSFVVWILLIELIIVPVSSIFDWEIWWSLIGAGIIATLAMQGFGKDLVVWMDSLMTQWWVGLVVLAGMVIVAIIYSIIFKKIGVMAKKAREKDSADRTKRDRKVLSVEAKLIKDSFGK